MNREIATRLALLLLFLANMGTTRGKDLPLSPPKRPADFKPFQFEYTTEQLKEKFSDAQMKRAAVELKEMQAVNNNGPWKPTWDSLDKHQAPEWFLDAKLGVMLNWGIHSVPAWDKDRGGTTATYPVMRGTTNR
jgi:hypothetical protein